ncbi:hypothetical protein MESS4_830197 [Mesorhizobium sp. STM 4661]|nr:hypothetical protein MESS4_830197 [Mesorhizobium sp. STM 4661]
MLVVIDETSFLADGYHILRDCDREPFVASRLSEERLCGALLRVRIDRNIRDVDMCRGLATFDLHGPKDRYRNAAFDVPRAQCMGRIHVAEGHSQVSSTASLWPAAAQAA